MSFVFYCIAPGFCSKQYNATFLFTIGGLFLIFANASKVTKSIAFSKIYEYAVLNVNSLEFPQNVLVKF